MLDKYCVECHNDAEFTADLSFEKRSFDNVHSDPAVWEEVLRKLKIRAMPPREQPQPDADLREEFVAALEGTLDAAAAAKPYAGATTVHRLNRAEYANAVRDLLGVEADLSSAAAERRRRLRLRQHRRGADDVAAAARALSDGGVARGRHGRRQPRRGRHGERPTESRSSTTQDQAPRRLPLGTRGGTRVRHNFPADGEYVLSGRLVRGVEEGCSASKATTGRTSSWFSSTARSSTRPRSAARSSHELSVAEGINVARIHVEREDDFAARSR